MGDVPAGKAPAAKEEPREYKQKALSRMCAYLCTKMETLEKVYAREVSPGTLKWLSSAREAEHTTLRDIHDTLVLVVAVERDFKRMLRDKLGGAKVARYVPKAAPEATEDDLYEIAEREAAE